MPPKGLLFSQEQGFDTLPEQAKVGTISQATSAALWRIIHDAIDVAVQRHRTSSFLATDIGQLLQDFWVDGLEAMIDDAPVLARQWKKAIRAYFDMGFPNPYNIAQFILLSPTVSRLDKPIENALISTRAAYRVVGKKIVPFASEEELGQFKRALSEADTLGASGAKAHLQAAAAELTSGNWSKSIHQSISAVESAARFKSGNHGKGLSDLIVELKKSGKLPHPALAAALTKIYAYSSDQKGIRHSLVLDGEASEDERDAFLMLGLCAAFVTYLLSQ